MIRILASLTAIFTLLVFAMIMNSALQSMKPNHKNGWRAKTVSVQSSDTDQRSKSFLRRVMNSVSEVLHAEKEAPKSDLQNLLDRRRRDTAPFYIRH